MANTWIEGLKFMHTNNPFDDQFKKECGIEAYSFNINMYDIQQNILNLSVFDKQSLEIEEPSKPETEHSPEASKAATSKRKEPETVPGQKPVSKIYFSRDAADEVRMRALVKATQAYNETTPPVQRTQREKKFDAAVMNQLKNALPPEIKPLALEPEKFEENIAGGTYKAMTPVPGDQSGQDAKTESVRKKEQKSEKQAAGSFTQFRQSLGQSFGFFSQNPKTDSESDSSSENSDDFMSADEGESDMKGAETNANLDILAAAQTVAMTANKDDTESVAFIGGTPSKDELPNYSPQWPHEEDFEKNKDYKGLIEYAQRCHQQNEIMRQYIKKEYVPYSYIEDNIFFVKRIKEEDKEASQQEINLKNESKSELDDIYRYQNQYLQAFFQYFQDFLNDKKFSSEFTKAYEIEKAKWNETQEDDSPLFNLIKTNFEQQIAEVNSIIKKIAEVNSIIKKIDAEIAEARNIEKEVIDLAKGIKTETVDLANSSSENEVIDLAEVIKPETVDLTNSSKDKGENQDATNATNKINLTKEDEDPTNLFTDITDRLNQNDDLNSTLTDAQKNILRQLYDYEGQIPLDFKYKASENNLKAPQAPTISNILEAINFEEVDPKPDINKIMESEDYNKKSNDEKRKIRQTALNFIKNYLDTYYPKSSTNNTSGELNAKGVVGANDLSDADSDDDTQGNKSKSLNTVEEIINYFISLKKEKEKDKEIPNTQTSAFRDFLNGNNNFNGQNLLRFMQKLNFEDDNSYETEKSTARDKIGKKVYKTLKSLKNPKIADERLQAINDSYKN